MNENETIERVKKVDFLKQRHGIDMSEQALLEYERKEYELFCEELKVRFDKFQIVFNNFSLVDNLILSLTVVNALGKAAHDLAMKLGYRDVVIERWMS